MQANDVCPHRHDEGAEPWQACASSDTKAQARQGLIGNPHLVRAYYLLRYTGQRRSDVVKMERKHFDGTAISVVQQKTGTHVWIPCHQRGGLGRQCHPSDQETKKPQALRLRLPGSKIDCL